MDMGLIHSVTSNISVFTDVCKPILETFGARPTSNLGEAHSSGHQQHRFTFRS